MATKIEPTLLERFEKHAPSKSVAKRVCSLVEKYIPVGGLTGITMGDLLAIPGIGRSAALLVMEVACDLAGKK